MLDRIRLWLDNPIFIKHCRARLRSAQLFPSLAIVMVIGMLICLMGYQWNGIGNGQTFGGLLMFQAILLGVMGASQVTSSVGQARSSGILDFHRVTPMRPFSMIRGFLFGGPVREYLMFAATLPFSMFCVWMGAPGALTAIQLLLVLIFGSWLMHTLGLLNALGGKVKTGSRGNNVVGLVMFLIFGMSWFSYGFLAAPTALDENPFGYFYMMSLPWLFVFSIALFPAIGFLLVGATRKLVSEKQHLFTKPQALGAMATTAFVSLGLLWGAREEMTWTLLLLYALLVVGIVLVTSVTPALDEFSKGVRQAAKEGRTYPSAWSDRGLNRISLFCICLILLVSTTVCWYQVERPVQVGPALREASYSLPIALGVLTLAYYGLALQYFLLRFGRRGPVFLALFLFLIWLVPLACSAASAMANARNWAANNGPDFVTPALASLSPIAGITVSTGLMQKEGLDFSKGAAILPALIFALLFNNLVTSIRRRIEKEIHEAESPKAKTETEVNEPALTV